MNPSHAPLKIGIFGRGRLGSALCAAGGADIAWALGRDCTPPAGEPVDVVIDASHGDAIQEHARWCAERGLPLVLAATGAAVQQASATSSQDVAVVVAPNGSLAVALFEQIAEQLGALATSLGGCAFLLDHHHAHKHDAPSGTALRLERAFNQGGGASAQCVRCADTLQTHSIRSGEEIGRHVLHLELPGESLEIEHRVFSREVFATGLLQAARWLARVRPAPGLYTLHDVFADQRQDSASHLRARD